jgi:hypothetical protein
MLLIQVVRDSRNIYNLNEVLYHLTVIKQINYIGIYWCVAYLPSEASIIEH